MPMNRTMLKSKIHRATVTGAAVDYEGSVTIDRDLMDMADILQYEAVDVWNVTSGSRFRTYAIAGERGSGTICINGAAARLAVPGDLVIIATWQKVDPASAATHQPRVVFVDGRNRVAEIRPERGGAPGSR
jgi:aspartate 1-decarboxylase